MPASDAPTPGSERDASPEDGDADPDSPAIALTRTDERVLAYLADVGTDYPAFVASNTGLYVDHVESRLDALDAAGLVERATGEEVFRVTDAGRDALREDCAAWSD
ncbi:DUF2250 domain-containing protein [Halorubrum lipolyticum]|uniref:DUF2250 domain-containing protein n=1 Tax=Halorubrum lipolyticum DSM 21995 TaxID=1227482 RepID=M0NM42_9EURY|nr:DUF2250 domain-containing protein [Halorubrum lipolyticum]EMA58224.1 hypothetical protein C469_13480 [Halorubrum lipolyticum DSM 21995]